MQKSLLIVAACLSLGACTLPKVPLQVAAVRQPDIDHPSPYPAVATVDVKFIDRPTGARDPVDPEGCVRIGAVYSNIGYGDWLSQVSLWRPITAEIRWQMRAEGGKIGANALALPNGALAELSELNFAVAYRCG